MDSGKAEALVLNEIEKEGGALAMKNLRFQKVPCVIEDHADSNVVNYLVYSEIVKVSIATYK